MTRVRWYVAMEKNSMYSVNSQAKGGYCEGTELGAGKCKLPLWWKRPEVITEVYQ